MILPDTNLLLYAHDSRCRGGHVLAWRSRRAVRSLPADAGHETAVFELLRAAGSAGANLVTDAQIAAIALHYRATVHTADQDFRRFPGIDCRFPLQELG